jgi:hypothetical protein
MRLHPKLVLFFVLFAAAPVQAEPPERARQPGTLRLSELRSASDRQLIRRLFGPVATFPNLANRILEGFPRRRQQADLWFYTALRATTRPGICEAQRMIVSFEPVEGTGLDDPLVQPRAFALQPVFFLENPEEAARPSSESRRTPEQLATACARAGPYGRNYPADDLLQLVLAFQLMDLLGEGARAGRAIAPLDCRAINPDGAPPPDEVGCLQRLSHMGRFSVLGTRACISRRPAQAGCISIQIPGMFIEFDLGARYAPRRVVVIGWSDPSPGF